MTRATARQTIEKAKETARDLGGKAGSLAQSGKVTAMEWAHRRRPSAGAPHLGAVAGNRAGLRGPRDPSKPHPREVAGNEPSSLIW
jgi:hypothetical protein